MIINRDDPYAVLGVARTATPAEVGHAYRALLRRHHPDTRRADDDNAHDLALQEVLNAYTDLHDRARRDHDGERSVRQAAPPSVAQTQPTVVIGNFDPPPIAVTPTWIRPHGSRPARPAPINLLIAFLEALPRGR